MKPVPGVEAVQASENADENVMVSMCDDHVVVCAPARLDVETTEILVVAVACALDSGFGVMMALDAEIGTDELASRRPTATAPGERAVCDAGSVRVLDAGRVGLDADESQWTIDVAQGRIKCSGDAIEPRSIASDDWISVQALWVTPAAVTALTEDGAYVSTSAAGAVQEPTRSESA